MGILGIFAKKKKTIESNDEPTQWERASITKKENELKKRELALRESMLKIKEDRIEHLQRLQEMRHQEEEMSELEASFFDEDEDDDSEEKDVGGMKPEDMIFSQILQRAFNSNIQQSPPQAVAPQTNANSERATVLFSQVPENVKQMAKGQDFNMILSEVKKRAAQEDEYTQIKLAEMLRDG